MPETPHPRTILRGHKAQVHALAFVGNNDRLASGDAEGYVTLWDLTIMRPTAVWQPHDNAILGIQGWGADRIITHGRDHKLAVWKLATSDEANLSKKLPLDDTSEPRPQPWLLHLIDVNTMNFCAFAACVPTDPPFAGDDPELLLAVPNTLASESIDIYHLPTQTRRHTVKSPGQNGMVMALALVPQGGSLTLLAGYENGVTTAMHLSAASGTWNTTYRTQPHSQPVLSLDVSPDGLSFVTSSADAVVARHPVPPPAGMEVLEQPLKVVNTKHSGQQSLRFRDDGRVFATGGWDAMVRVYSGKTMKEVAVLKWHEVGCYAVAFASALKAPQAAGGVEERGGAVVRRAGEVSVRERRIAHAEAAHWLAAGSKDGKISLWDIF
ncbi:ASTRA complex subunit [Verticillium nonalfalfae]|uniref:ASTRA-associated protein 1 n=1 Tax=Verticillium nonalfalfae TaxID=1051616 RepID=A0A3M9Y5D4_9PEZI|nr:ASTRA complex subunit [Verticillium nonalfalfae]RNJ55703.1 ASTRA complex subunit [Verticillium nonalfalfae]